MHRGASPIFALRLLLTVLAAVVAAPTAHSTESAAPSGQAPGGSASGSIAQVLRRSRGSVFEVISEHARGSGFLIDERGLVATRYQIVGDSRYLAVRLDDQKKYPAAVVASDPDWDVSILRVHPDAVRGVTPLPLASSSDSADSLQIGDPVLALGSPLASSTIATTGILGRIDDRFLHSDARVDSGNAGGPLLDRRGRVIGLNTFGRFPPADRLGSGAIRVDVAAALLETARGTLGNPPPEGRLLPEPAPYRYPAKALREISLGNADDPMLYFFDAGPFDVQLVTPVVIARMELRGEAEAAARHAERSKGKGRPYVPGAQFFEWRRHLGDYRPVVTVQVIPEVNLTPESKAALVLIPGLTPEIQVKTAFDRMELLRDGVVVEPIRPGLETLVINVSAVVNNFKDIAYYGAYEYPPEAFRPGAEVVLRIWEQGRDEPITRTILPGVVRLVWDDFYPYFEFLKSVGQP